MREISIATRDVQTENDFRLTLQYILLVETLSGEVENYGAKIVGAENDTVAMAPGLTVDSRRILALIEMMASNTVTPAGFMDIVSDWL